MLIPDLVIYAIVAVLAILGLLIAYTFWYKPGRPAMDPQRLMGMEGRTTSSLKSGKYGTAIVGSEEWTVTSSEDIPIHSAVKVVEVRGVTLVVEKSRD